MVARPQESASSSRPRISRAFVEEHRRRRYAEASAEILHEFGRPGATTTNVVRLAGGSRATFYEAFTGVEDCIAYGIGLAEVELFASLEELPGDGEWLGELDQAIGGFYGAVASRPLLAELFLIHAASSREDRGRAAFREGGARFARLIDRGRGEAEARTRRPPPRLVAEALSWAIVWRAAEAVRVARVEGLPAEARPMAVLVAGYYLGPETAAAALSPLP